MEENLTQEESLIKRIVICGPESTGKTTMINNLSVYFKLIMLMNLLEIFFKKNGIVKKKFAQKKISFK